MMTLFQALRADVLSPLQYRLELVVDGRARNSLHIFIYI